MIKVIRDIKTNEKSQRKQATTRDLTKEEYRKQIDYLNRIYLLTDDQINDSLNKKKTQTQNDDIGKYILEIKDKLRGYYYQDKTKWCVNQVNSVSTDKKESITWDELIELLVTSKLLCSYCRGCIYILYETSKDPEQWTLDRIDNTEHHHRENCVISCLKCNLEKRDKSDKAFRFTKQLKIIKKE